MIEGVTIDQCEICNIRLGRTDFPEKCLDCKITYALLSGKEW